MLNDVSQNNKRIAKNTMMLYIRMCISMFVGLYTSRVVLQILGVEDYGIYGVVGSVVAMMGFLNSSMSGATSRFLTFELGKGCGHRLLQTFSSAVIVHIAIALIVLVLAETLGLWFLCNKLIIPENRMFAAHCVYQLSIFSAMISITQVPYNACIIAHEKMDIYAYVEMLNIILKLLIIYLLVIGNLDKLILYSLLTLIVSVAIAMIYRIYCTKNFDEARIHFIVEKDVIKPILSFSMWDLYGNFSVTVRSQGRNFLINMFFGVIYNAASSVATTVAGTVLGFTGTIVQAFRPHIIKLYAQKKIEEMQIAASNAIKYSLLLMSLMAVPLIIEADYVFKLWLVEVPPYTVVFCRLILISSALGIVNTVVSSIIHATGDIKRISIITGTIYWMHLPFIYVAFKLGANVTSSYVVEVFGVICIVLLNLFIAKHNVPELSKRNFIKSIIIALLVIAPASIVTYVITLHLGQSILRLLLSIVCNMIIVVVLSYCIILDDNTRLKVSQKLASFLKFN